MVKPQEVTRQRLAAQGLSGALAPSPEGAVQRLLAVQAQDKRGFRLSVRPRSQGLSSADVNDALTQRRSLVVATLNRGTLHLVLAEDYWWLHPLTNPQLGTGNLRRLAQLGVSRAQAERAVAIIAEHVSQFGPRTRAELRSALSSAKVRTAGQAFVHIVLAASVGGHIVRGPMRGSEQCFVGTEAWLGRAPAQLERPEALARLARRYLVGHGPADAADLANWAGTTLTDARSGLAAIAGELVRYPDGLVDLSDRPSPAPLPGPRLLGPFDPLLHGWVSTPRHSGRTPGS